MSDRLHRFGRCHRFRARRPTGSSGRTDAGLGLGGGTPAGTASGSVIVNAAPPPGRLAAVAVPPCSGRCRRRSTARARRRRRRGPRRPARSGRRRGPGPRRRARARGRATVMRAPPSASVGRRPRSAVPAGVCAQRVGHQVADRPGAGGRRRRHHDGLGGVEGDRRGRGRRRRRRCRRRRRARRGRRRRARRAGSGRGGPGAAGRRRGSVIRADSSSIRRRIIDGAGRGPGSVAAQAEQLGEALDRRERRAQLVGGVGQELAQALLGGLPLGEGRLDARRAWC